MNLDFLTDKVDMVGDGVPLSPEEYGRLLSELTAKRKVVADYYSSGGIVAEFERRAARILGKEDALILPTGTMANFLALNALAGQGSRVLVQYDSHINRDSGDVAQNLGGMHLIPLKPGGIPEVVDLQKTLASFADEKVEVPITTMHLESPIRRLQNAAFPLDQFDKLTSFAQQKGMKLHLDGARLLIWSVWCGRSAASIAAPFETVYISLWKHFNSLFGAILAGPAEMINRLRHQRRRGGGALAQIWPVALVAGYFMEGFTERLAAARIKSLNILSELDFLSGMNVNSPPNATNALLLRWDCINAKSAGKIREKLSGSNIQLPAFNAKNGGFWIKVNETWNNMGEDEVIGAFKKTLTK